MTVFHLKLADLARVDGRYAYEAYEFIFLALEHTHKLLGHQERTDEQENRATHVTGQQLLQGARDLALQEFGMMARTVFRQWGINQTEDFGNIVFNLVEAGLMSKTPDDQLSDFRDVFDLDEALAFEIQLDEAD